MLHDVFKGKLVIRSYRIEGIMESDKCRGKTTEITQKENSVEFIHIRHEEAHLTTNSVSFFSLTSEEWVRTVIAILSRG